MMKQVKMKMFRHRPRKVEDSFSVLAEILDTLQNFFLSEISDSKAEIGNTESSREIQTSQSHHEKHYILTTIKIKIIQPEKLTEINLIIGKSARKSSQ